MTCLGHAVFSSSMFIIVLCASMSLGPQIFAGVPEIGPTQKPDITCRTETTETNDAMADLASSYTRCELTDSTLLMSSHVKIPRGPRLTLGVCVAGVCFPLRLVFRNMFASKCALLKNPASKLVGCWRSVDVKIAARARNIKTSFVYVQVSW
jgi:hypothetical protein